MVATQARSSDNTYRISYYDANNKVATQARSSDNSFHLFGTACTFTLQLKHAQAITWKPALIYNTCIKLQLKHAQAITFFKYILIG